MDLTDSPRVWLWIVIALALASIWPLVGPGDPVGGSELSLPEVRDFERLFFEPQQSAPALIVMIAAGLLAMRAPRFFAMSPTRRIGSAGIALTASLAFAAWSRLSAADDLLVFSLISCIAGFALATRGGRGLGLLLPPLAALLFAVPVPGRISNEIIWQLQLVSTDGAEWLLRALGLTLHRDGLFMWRNESGFLVIESCSGFRSVQILTLLAIVVGELLSLRRRTLLLCAAAPVIAYGLNVMRIAWIVLGDQDTATAGEHVGQGMTVLIVGTVILFGLARLLEPRQVATADDAAPSPTANLAPSPATAGSLGVSPWRRLAGFLAVLATVVYAMPTWPAVRWAPLPLDALFQTRAGWTPETLSVDRIFLGSVGIGQITHRRLRYEGSRQASQGPVEVFVAIEAMSAPRRSPVSDKLLLPSREWGLESVEAHRDWRLFRDTQEAIVRREGRRMLVRLWYVNDPGPIPDVLRSLFALVRGPVEPERRRAVVRIATPLPGKTPRALSIARARLDQLVLDYRADLELIGS